MFRKVDASMNFPAVEERILEFWKQGDMFKKSLKLREGAKRYVFFEGPPTANGKPHPGHVLTRAIKDLFPRYKTMCGYHVPRKGGWDTHGLPVELEVEKELGISGKPQIEQYGVERFVEKCKESVFRYEKEHRDMTERMGFWLDMENPYITCQDAYIESVWWALKQLWEKDLLYKGHKVVPYCPRCGTALSSHEVAQGYEDVEDPSVFVRFRSADEPETSFLVWTTTPWTLPSNVALAVAPDADYVVVRQGGEKLILAKELADKALKGEYEVLETVPGKDLKGRKYRPIFPYVKPEKPAYYVVTADFVVMTEGTGIVHIAPAFGEDDMRVGVEYGLPVVQPVDSQGRFTPEITPWAGKFVKHADPEIIETLRESGALYKEEKYQHSYPFCWRCSTPLLYYARSSWFVRMTAVKDKLLENNNKVNWYPDHIRDGRFGNFLENVIDWAISRERYWGTPLNIWVCQDCGHHHVVGSVEELRSMAKALPKRLELHRPWIDQAILACPKCGADMRRVPEVLDCWFDSGSMPYAQWHYPFENREIFQEMFPADFVSEAIDQTRGWFYTLMALATTLFGEAPYKNVVVLGLVLDDQGFKMSKSKGNVVDPWEIFDNEGADALRWYLYTTSPPWNPKRFSREAISEAQRKFLGTLWNVYSFYVLYANIDKFNPRKHVLPLEKRALIDRWIISRLHGLIAEVREELDGYDVTTAGRKIEEFVDDLSNWYVRRSRRRYWGSDMDDDKVAAYLTLHEVLVTLAKLIAPFTPFIAEELYQNLERSVHEDDVPGVLESLPESVHLCDYPVADEATRDLGLEKSMELAREVVFLGRAGRNAVNIKNRQPLSRIIVKLRDASERDPLLALEAIVKDELNVKTVEFTDSIDQYVSYQVKPRFDVLGPKLGKLMPKVAKALAEMDGNAAAQRISAGGLTLVVDGIKVELGKDDVIINARELEGYHTEAEREYAVVLDTTLTEELIDEGFAREMVNKIQTSRKEAGFEIEDRISTWFWGSERVKKAVEAFRDYVSGDTLSEELEYGERNEGYVKTWNVNGEQVTLSLVKVSS